MAGPTDSHKDLTMTNLLEIINRLNGFARHDRPTNQANELHLELTKRTQQLRHIIGDDAIQRFTVPLQQLDACRQLNTHLSKHLIVCQQGVLESAASLRRPVTREEPSHQGPAAVPEDSLRAGR
jgi:hypothetical protein